MDETNTNAPADIDHNDGNNDKDQIASVKAAGILNDTEVGGGATRTEKELNSSSKDAVLDTSSQNEEEEDDDDDDSSMGDNKEDKDEDTDGDDDKADSGQREEAKKGKGRRGDPRMHRAVAARLAKPQLSLFQALVAGGFKFPVSEMASKGNGPIYDYDNVLLSQRKNQLSRRLRLLARRRQSHQMALNASAAASQEGMTLEKSNKIVSAIEANNTLLLGGYQTHFPQIPGGVYPGMNAMQQIQMQNLLQQQQQMVRSSAAALGLNKFNSNPTMLASQLGHPPLAAQMPVNIGVHTVNNANSSSPATPAEHPVVPPAPGTASNPEALYKLKLEQAIKFYKNEKEALKKRALIAAGFKENEFEAVSEEYQRKLSEIYTATGTQQEAKNSNGGTEYALSTL